MAPLNQVCDIQRIEEYLDERLSDSDRETFEQHLGECQYCQLELHGRAAEPDMWRDAVELLSESPPELAPDTADHQDTGRHAALGVLDLLTPTDDPEMLGRIGDYEVSGVVGVGGMGAVLKGYDRSLRRVVAIKIMAPHLAGSGSARTRFQREARAAAAITHSNVIDTYGVSEANGVPYLVMPFARGPSLQKRIDTSGPLTAVEVVRIGHQIASGLAAAHEQGLVHRDIKPANILLNEGIERLWITDFGVARAMDDASMTQTGVIAGTPQYMSPEQARGESVDHRSDLFSMGSVLYTACTGRPPFRAEAAYGILRRITDTDPHPVRELNSEIPDWLCRIIELLMAKHPEDRYQSAGEVAEILEGCLAHLQQPTQISLPQSVRPARAEIESESREMDRSPATQPQPSRFRRYTVRIATATFAVLALALIGMQASQPVDISGRWSGELWKTVSLTAAEEASGWYRGSFTDTTGRRGTLQLEWSRLHRRYSGRWRVGDDHSGSITFRVRGAEGWGAVAVDPEAAAPAKTPRLRDFVWRRGTGTPGTAAPQGQVAGRAAAPMPLYSPFDGRVVRLGDGVFENAHVRKGTLIAELASVDGLDQKYLEAQASATAQQLEASHTLLEASIRELEQTRTNLAALEAKQKAYEQVMAQVARAATASVESAREQITLKKVEESEVQIALDQAQADFTRQQQLFDKKLISEQAFEAARRTLADADAKLQKARTYVRSAESELVAVENDEKARATRAQLDAADAAAAVSKASSEVVAVESNVARARQDIVKLEASAADLKIQLERRKVTTAAIMAPADGIVTQVVGNRLLRTGDQVCVLWPDSTSHDRGSGSEDQPASIPGDSEVNQPASPAAAREGHPPDQPPRRDSAVGVAARSTISGLPVTRTIDSAMALGRRIVQLRGALRTASEKKTGESNAEAVETIRRRLDVVEHERAAAVSILEAQLESTRALHKSQINLSEVIKRRVDSGDADPPSLLPAEDAVLTSAAEIKQLELLLEYYGDLGRTESPAEANVKNIATSVLEVRLAAVRKRLQFQERWSRIARARFEAGADQLDELLRTEQAEALTAAELKEIEALLGYYAAILDTQDAGILPPDQGVLSPAASEKERQAIIDVLTARLEAATALREQSKRNLDRQQRLFQENITPETAVDAARASAAQAEAEVKELTTKLEYYKSQSQ